MSDQDTDPAETGGEAELDVEDRIDEAGESGEQSVDDVDVEQLERERQERLDPDNRPDGAEVDNTGRDFDPAVGLFTDSDGYDEAKAQADAESDAGSESEDDDEVVDTDAAAETSVVESGQESAAG